MEPEVNGMLSDLTTTAITTNATQWVGEFGDLLLVVIGIGIGFSVVRFVKGLFS